MHHRVPDGVHNGVRNGMPARALGTLDWRRPWSDDGGGACVEVKKPARGRVAVRQSTDPTAPHLSSPRTG